MDSHQPSGPTGDAELASSQRHRIDRVGKAFEARWRAGAQPRIEDYLDGVGASLRAALLSELLARELEFRQGAGEEVQLTDLHARFPDDLDAVDAGWAIVANRRPPEAASRGLAALDPGHSTRSVSTVDPSRKGELDPGGAVAAAGPAEARPLPERIGRYIVEDLLGEGGFGRVYLAHDPQLERHVALKVPGRKLLASPARVDEFLHEARAAARLNHPGIVTIYDVQQEGDSVYIVQEYVQGLDLRKWARATNPTVTQIVHLLVEITAAVGVAHQHELVHRDLKPANILIDSTGHAHVADFGLALDESMQRLKTGEISGTPGYMSPDQVRGLTHRLDGRTDLWSLGVMLYELLTGRRPFRGQDHVELFDEIKHRDPKPPRQIMPEVPQEIERICLKCLAKRRTERYASAAELLDDLRCYLKGPDASGAEVNVSAVGEPTGDSSTAKPTDTRDSSTPPKIVPKGLRSFDAHDADFFLELLPGARDRDGLPESIRFWKTRVEKANVNQTFAIGLIYGPSGCGKSSLVKAGLLPRLAAHVRSVYVEAAPEDTELRLLQGLRRNLSDPSPDAALPELLAGVREGLWLPEGQQLLIVLDQFEQWLHARRGQQDTQLVQALRHCDGARLQCITLVRDDFWLAASRFMQDLEVRLVEGENSALIDLFDLRHARRVLAEFGRAYGCLPDNLGELNRDQERFLDRAVDGLARDGKIICVRLALFADMLKGKRWTAATLAGVGGTEGLGVTFLEETFSASSAPAPHRHHQKAAQRVLKALLPETGTDIKGSRRSYGWLLEASDYGDRKADFADLIQVLDSEVRLITPTVPEGEDVGAEGTTFGKSHDNQKFYQLTHDFLVPSLCDWLTRKQRETRRGRAQLRLVERAAQWNAKPENRYLPKAWEHLNIRLFTRKKDWDDRARKMMRRSGRLHGLRALAAAVLVVLIAGVGYEINGRYQASKLVEVLDNAKEDAVLATAQQLHSYWHWARPLLVNRVQNDAVTPAAERRRLHARIALVGEDESQVAPLRDALLTSHLNYVGVIREALLADKSLVIEQLRRVLKNASSPPELRFRAGLALAKLDSDGPWTESITEFLVTQLVGANPEVQPQLRGYLADIGDRLLLDIEKVFQDEAAGERQRIGAANAVSEFARGDVPRITRLASVASPDQYAILYPLLESSNHETVHKMLRKQMTEQPSDDLTQPDRVALGRRRAAAAITLLRLGERERLFDVFRVTDDPESLTQFVHRCRSRGATLAQLLECLDRACQLRETARGLEGQVENRVLFGILLALGEFEVTDLPVGRSDPLIKQLAHWYADDPSSTVHGATGWLLRHWGYEAEAERVDQTPSFDHVPRMDELKDREWFVLGIQTDSGNKEKGSSVKLTICLTLVVFPPGEFLMGSPENELDRETSESLHKVRLTRPLAVSDREITWGQFTPSGIRLRDGSSHHDAWEKQFSRTLLPGEPAFGVNWYEAVKYCRWLTERSGLSASEQCYEDPESLLKDAEGNPTNWPLHLNRLGFRLPTEAEWEYVCRSGTRTAYSCGGDVELLGDYAWLEENSKNWSHPVGQLRPNLRGLFDLHGNVHEWCHDWYDVDSYADSAKDPTGADVGPYRVSRGGSWNLPAQGCRTASRNGLQPTYRSFNLGFRVAFVPSVRQASQESAARGESR